MLVQIKYIRKDEAKSLRRMRKASFIAETLIDGRAMFNKWCWNELGLNHHEDVLVITTRDATEDNVTLDVKDINTKMRGHV